MSGGNLPDGVTVDMLPGNRPQDAAYEAAMEEASCDLEWTIRERVRELCDQAEDEYGVILDPDDLLTEALREIGDKKGEE